MNSTTATTTITTNLRRMFRGKEVESEAGFTATFTVGKAASWVLIVILMVFALIGFDVVTGFIGLDQRIVAVALALVVVPFVIYRLVTRRAAK